MICSPQPQGKIKRLYDKLKDIVDESSILSEEQIDSLHF